MEYFFYGRDRPGSGALRLELVEAHWSFMDRYAEAMIARGPTLAADEETATGSVHIVGLPGADAARVLPLLDTRSFTFLIEDPATVWHLGPERYPAIAERYPLYAGLGAHAVV